MQVGDSVLINGIPGKVISCEGDSYLTAIDTEEVLIELNVYTIEDRDGELHKVAIRKDHDD